MKFFGSMANKEEIDKAIASHGAWKARLRQVIEIGVIETPVEVIKLDNVCVFGQWLYSDHLNASDKLTAQYEKVKELHAEFHLLAARIAELAQADDKTGAERLMGNGSKYAAVSSKLTMALIEWKKS